MIFFFNLYNNFSLIFKKYNLKVGYLIIIFNIFLNFDYIIFIQIY